MGLSLPLDIALPTIEISFASPSDDDTTHKSPFAFDSYDKDHDNDSYRPMHLSPPPTQTRLRPTRTKSPLAANAEGGKGLDADRFEALLRASKNASPTRPNNTVAPKQKDDLRKEILSNAHKQKQLERRALFLSKLAAPPSPGATLLPKTPPETPAVFHYTLPSPGLVSPLALFDALKHTPNGGLSYPREPWVEQVDFRKTAPPVMKSARRRSMPSLEEITARLEKQNTSKQQPLSVRPAASSSRLPAFLKHARRFSDPVPTLLQVEQEREEHQAVDEQPKFCLIVDQPPAADVREPVQNTTTTTRERRATNMLSTIRRRVVSEGPKALRRHSAPANLMLADQQRTGFEHPVLLLPGGF